MTEVERMKKRAELYRLPMDVQANVLETLKAWTGCEVYIDSEEHYRVAVGAYLTASEPDEWRVASFKAEDFYTPEERERNAADVWGGADMSAW